MIYHRKTKYATLGSIFEHIIRQQKSGTAMHEWVQIYIEEGEAESEAHWGIYLFFTSKSWFTSKSGFTSKKWVIVGTRF